jgi:hypothetical protein
MIEKCVGYFKKLSVKKTTSDVYSLTKNEIIVFLTHLDKVAQKL